MKGNNKNITPPEPFRAFRLLGKSFCDLKRHRDMWVRIGVLPFLLSCCVLWGWAMVGGQVLLSCPGMGSECIIKHYTPFMNMKWLLIGIVSYFLTLLTVAFPSITVNRFIIKNERPNTCGFPQASIWVKWIIYQAILLPLIVIAFLLLVALVSGLIMGGSFEILDHTNLNRSWLSLPAGVLMGGFLAVTIYLSARLLLLFPAISVEQRDPLRTSWPMTRPHVWRLLGGFIVMGFVCGLLTRLALFCTTWIWRVLPWLDRVGPAVVESFLRILSAILIALYLGYAFKALERKS